MKFNELRKNEIDSQNIHSSQSPLFRLTLVTLVVVGIATTVLGFFCKWFVKHHHQHVPDFIKRRMVYRKEMLNPDMEALNDKDLDNNSEFTHTPIISNTARVVWFELICVFVKPASPTPILSANTKSLKTSSRIQATLGPKSVKSLYRFSKTVVAF